MVGPQPWAPNHGLGSYLRGEPHKEEWLGLSHHGHLHHHPERCTLHKLLRTPGTAREHELHRVTGAATNTATVATNVPLANEDFGAPS